MCNTISARARRVALCAVTLGLCGAGLGGVGCTPDPVTAECVIDSDCTDARRNRCSVDGQCFDPSVIDAGRADAGPPGRCEVDPDRDGDGYDDHECGGDDCNDTQAQVHPGAPEICDPADPASLTRDENCNAGDQGLPMDRSPIDEDGDGFVRIACSNGSMAAPVDCDDTQATVHPGALELCDGIDNDCDGVVDDGASEPVFADCDGDGAGTGASSSGCHGTPLDRAECPSGTWVRVMGDCNDTDPLVHPTAADGCPMPDGLDNDCDTRVDEHGTELVYPDCDHDAYPRNDRSEMACAGAPLPAGLSATLGCHAEATWLRATTTFDCNDEQAAINPAAPEACNGIDDNCSGAIDEGLTVGRYRDIDGDGHGAGALVDVCPGTPGYVESSRDCNDNDVMIRPGATERCNGLDDDCNGAIDGFSEACSNTCGTGMRTCTTGAWGGCSATGSRGCSSACGAPGSQSCSGGVWGACGSYGAGPSRSCSPNACGASGTQTCVGESWGACSYTPYSRSCTSCSGRTSGTETCGAGGSWSTCTAATSGTWPGACTNGAWPHNNLVCSSGGTTCVPQGGTLTVNGSALSAAAGCGSASGTSWVVPGTVDSICEVGQFTGSLPHGTYEFRWQYWAEATTCIDGVWIDFNGGTYFAAACGSSGGSWSDCRLASCSSSTGDIVARWTGSGVPNALNLYYRGGFYGHRFQIYSLRITRL